MTSAIQDNSFDSSRTHSSREDNYTNATTPELDENDGATSAESDEEDDDAESQASGDASIASYDSDFPDEYIIHDHEATRTGKYSAIHCSNGHGSIETNQCWSIPKALTKGPLSIDFLATSSALTKRIQETYHNFPNLVKLEIAALVLLPEYQTIRVIWNHGARE